MSVYSRMFAILFMHYYSGKSKGMSECEDGLYGQNCEYKCGHCSAGSCNRNGHCLQCEDGMLMPFCTACIANRYGHLCSLTCGYCVPRICDNTTGYCLECETGYIMPYCTEKNKIYIVYFVGGAVLGLICVAIAIFAIKKGKCALKIEEGTASSSVVQENLYTGGSSIDAVSLKTITTINYDKESPYTSSRGSIEMSLEPRMPDNVCEAMKSEELGIDKKSVIETSLDSAVDPVGRNDDSVGIRKDSRQFDNT